MGEPVPCLRCTGCDVMTRADCMEDCSDLRPVLGLCCERCADEASYEAHQRDCDEWHTCDRCERARARADRLRRAAEARVHGGVSSAGLRLVGLDGGDDV
jgi:phage terminase Nu1 subunit (DNA packaging protein)